MPDILKKPFILVLNGSKPRFVLNRLFQGFGIETFVSIELTFYLWLKVIFFALFSLHIYENGRDHSKNVRYGFRF